MSDTITTPTLLTTRELAAWRGLLRAHASLVRALDADLERAHGLPLSTYEVLMHVHDAPGGRMRMSDLADRGLLSRSGLTRLVDRLVRDGLIARESCPSDARGSFAVITGAGRAKLNESRATHLDGVRARFLLHISDAEQELLGDIWGRVDPAAHVSSSPGC